LRRLGKGVEHVPAQALLVHAPLAARAAHAQGVQVAAFGQVTVEQRRLAALGAVQRVCALVVVLVQLKVGQALVPAPVVVTRDLRPMVIVARLSAHVDHAVDAAAAAQHLAARVAERAAVQALGGFGLVEPVGARVADAIQIPHRNVHPVVIVLLAGLDQQHPLAGVCAQPVGQQTAGRAAADDDVVEGGVAHRVVLLRRRLCMPRHDRNVASVTGGARRADLLARSDW